MNWRLLRSGASDPAWNMAVDEALLLVGGPPTLRLYAWDPFALSLGYFQRFADVEAAVRASGLGVVRRLTGGGAVIHRDELTYAVVAPAEAAGDGTARGAYAVIHQGIRRALARLGVEVTVHEKAAARTRRSALAAVGAPAPGDRPLADGADPEPASPPALCFERPRPLDLAAGDAKIAGSAQRRVRTPSGVRFLQHGSLPLGETAGGGTSVSRRLGRRVAWDEAADAVAREVAAALGVGLVPAGLAADEEALARRLRRERYATDEWTRRR